MKILHTVQFYYPSTGGMQEVVKQLSERLVKLGNEVTVTTSYDPHRSLNEKNRVKIVQFKVYGNYVYGIKGEVDKYQKFILSSNFDIVTNFAAQQWASDSVFPILDQIKAKKVFVPTGFSGFYNPEYKVYFQKMSGWMKQYDMNIFLSNDYRDINFARKNGIKKTMIISNGADENEFLRNKKIDIRKKIGISKNDFIILHVGSHTGTKGHREAFQIFSKAKLKNAVFLIVGNTFNKLCRWKCKLKQFSINLNPINIKDRKKVMVVELPRSETVEAYKEANVFLFPSNIECSPIVLFEAAASKTAYLTSDVGNSKEITQWLKGGLVMPTVRNDKGVSYVKINESVKLLEKLYRDKKLRDSLAENGFREWKKNFTWKKISKEYNNMYKFLMKN